MALLTLSFPNVSTVAALLALVSAVYLSYLFFVRPLLSPLLKFPGPKSEHWLFGNLLNIHRSQTSAAHESWIKKYGPVVSYHGFAGETRIFFSDPRALNHVLVSQSYNYPKPANTRGVLKRILGNGVLFVEGDDHRRTRKVLQPSFSPAQVSDLVPTFFEFANKLRDKWVRVVEEGKGDKDYAVIDVGPGLGKATLDIIGKAGFDYDFRALDGGVDRLAEAFTQLQRSGGSNGYAEMLIFLLDRFLEGFGLSLPRIFSTKRGKATATCLKTMEDESRRMLALKKQAVTRELNGGGNQNGSGEKGQLEGKDLMSVLVKANMSSDAKARLSDEELVPQMTTFLLAGHETTATATTWLLWQLAKSPDVQTRLRKEIRDALAEAGSATLTTDQIQALPYLEAVTREILRFLSPVPGTLREAAIDDRIPLSEPIKLRDGTMADHIPVRRGDKVFIAIQTFNRSAALFGPDAESFNPDRWLDVKKTLGGAGVYAGMLTFLAGPRGCIGYRFALLELKALIVALVGTLAFATRDEDGGPEIEKQALIVMKPRVKGEKYSTMPLRVSLAR